MRSPFGWPGGHAKRRCRFVATRSGILIPLSGEHAKKSPEVSLDASSNLAVRGGFTRCARPSGGLAAMQNGIAVLSPPGRGFSSPSQENMQKKSPEISLDSSLNVAVRGGFEPPIRCRIHTFQACSFSHSDTSPQIVADRAGSTGRYYREST